MVDAKSIIENALKEGRNFLLEPEAKTLCRIYGLPVTKFKVAKNLSEVKQYAEEIGYPIVLKIVSPDILHKSDVGGVVINIRNEEELVQAYNRIMNNVKEKASNARIYGILVQEFAPPGREVIVGVAKDPQFKHVIMFGLGGIFVEILKDVTFRVLPITRDDAEAMIKEIRGYHVLVGYRGQPPADVQSIVDIMLRVSKLINDFPSISQLDLNPIIVYEKGAKIIDARIILESE